MSCVDIMYQPYASYFSPYHRFHDPTKRLDVPKMHEPSTAQQPLDSTDYSSAATSSGGTLVPKREDPEEEKETQPKDTQYLTASCVLHTYFSGDISSVVDDHFTRALSQNNSYTGTCPTSKGNWKDASPMAERNFPPSFWNSHYQHATAASAAPSHQDLQFPTDPYMSTAAASLHGVTALHQDPWHPYSLTSQAHSYHRPMHDLPYSSMAASNKFSPHYSSLLMQPSSMRTGRCDLSKPAETWTPRYHHHSHTETLSSDLLSHHNAHLESSHTGLETVSASALPEPSSKDMYWF
ncbi:transcription cofactor vestigial-like protein 2 isoform X2 [Lineus longissimus]|uniref:transcription cofactor vestigial-like protein 2 isoform X2 n=1 Tax=Lineus longissimus TaxID=88925 RepID=UPI00315CFC89